MTSLVPGASAASRSTSNGKAGQANPENRSVAGGAIRIRGARQNNLCDVDVDIPRHRLVAITGVSGSGKSSLAFDTLFREGQRRFLETLSAYARQFLGRMEKPDVDHVEGLSPAIAVDQKAIQRGPRSTVGTITEIVDHLRVLYARAGTAHCPEHGRPLATQTAESVVSQVQGAFLDQAVHVLAPLIRDRKGHHKPLFQDLARKGFVRARINGEVHRLEEAPELERYKRHTIEVVVDRLKVQESSLSRVREAVVAALELGKGDCIVVGSSGETSYSTQRNCSMCGIEAPILEPRLFSFNSPHGACSQCEGMGVLRRPSAGLVVANPALSIRAGALAVTRASGGALLFPRVSFKFLERVGEENEFDLDTPWSELTPAARRIVLRGSGEQRYEDKSSWEGKRNVGSVKWQRRYRGVLPALEKAWKAGGRKKQLDRFLELRDCKDCQGERLNAHARAVTVGGVGLAELLRCPLGKLVDRLDSLQLEGREETIASGLLLEIQRRVAFLLEVGLNYLSLDRTADTLSGGEAQRIRLAAQLGAGLQGVLYVLDEPSIGLHPRDHGRLFGALQMLRDSGNTVVVVEHDEATLRSADWLIDIGPGPGRHGGRVVAAGPPSELSTADSPTGRLLRGELAMPAPKERRRGNGNELRIEGARGFNLQGVDVSIPLGTLTVVSGVSGSGKSTLVHHTLQRALCRHLGLESPQPEAVDRIVGLEHVEDMVFLSAAPIGRTPRSNPATYSGAFTPIRDLFASLPEAKMRGWLPGRFSFNVSGGRCESCQGAGAQLVELQFLAPVTVPCEECGGHRFQYETLDVHYRGHSIADVLAMTIEEAHELFIDMPKIARPLGALVEVGVGYLTLGQPSTTLSGGEAQRVKLGTHLQRRSRKHTVYMLDEPTTGLHHQDVQCLVSALQALVEQGHTVVVIEHMLELIAAADHVIDLGPDGGDGGGRILVAGTPEEVEANQESPTGQALRDARAARGAGLAPPDDQFSVTAPTEIRIEGARTHNLKNISLSLPLGALTVITGPSGSGKSSLALDTIYATGRQRFVESLSTYARQFLAARDRAPVDRIEGLGPCVAVEARTSSGHPRSTVATTTEIHDLMRVMWARAGTRKCPDHGVTLQRTDPGQITRQILRELDGQTGWIVAPFKAPGLLQTGDLKQEFVQAAVTWRRAGFLRLLFDGVEKRLDDVKGPPAGCKRIDVVVDRLTFDSKDRARIAEAVETAAMLASGRIGCVTRVSASAKDETSRRIDYSTRGACTTCGFQLEEELEPRHFSFNAHVGACPECHGLGQSWQCSAELLVDHPELPLLMNETGPPTAIGGKLGRYLTKGKGYYEHLLREVGRSHRFDLSRPFDQLTEAARELVLHGTGARPKYEVNIDRAGSTYEMHESFSADWPGLCGHVDAWHAKAEDPEWRAILEKFMARTECGLCKGERLAPGPRAVTLGRKRLPQVLGLSVTEALAWLEGLKLNKSQRTAVNAVVEELLSRVSLLDDVGLGYLTLDRNTSTLSGGEARRVRLSASLGSKLVGVCYVLDEPTVGLHPSDISRLTDALLALRDGGNTVFVVEHDETLMRRADYLVDMGPGAGREGGQVVAAGTPAEVEAHSDSVTGRALRGELELVRRDKPASAFGGRRSGIGITGARLNNLRGVSFDAEFGRLTGVCGPSGSGKSTLILDCLVPALRGDRAQGRWKTVRGSAGGTQRLVLVDASPLGRTPKSTPATATGLMDLLRELFARTPEARMRGLKAFSFSFNSTQGRCPACEGRGSIKVEMQFLADLWLTCEECRGRRYRPETLEVLYRGSSIADVLEMSVDELLAFLQHVPKVRAILETLTAVGLGYLSLGQSATTLSSGEAQRVKLASELSRSSDAARTVVILDEPTTGLAKSDVVHLYAVLRRLADRGDAVIVIEHHTDLLNACDELVELGPGGGNSGGSILCTGTPADLIADPASVTGPWLAESLAAHKGKRRKARKRSSKKERALLDGAAPVAEGATAAKAAKGDGKRKAKGVSL